MTSLNSLAPNTTLQEGKYQIKQQIGKGGFGITYLVSCLYLGSDERVIKEFCPKDICYREKDNSLALSNTDYLVDFNLHQEKFYEEARILSSLNEVEGVVDVSDVFFENNTIYIVMPYLSGGDFNKYLNNKENKRLSEEETLAYMKQLCEIVIRIHDRNFLHRDIKPSNLMFDKKGKLILIDFGMAKDLYYALNSEITTIGNPAVSHGYSAPEQYNQSQKKDVRTDIYALGALCYKMITGNVLPAATVRSLNSDILFQEDYIEISHNLKEIITKAVALKPSERFQNADELLEAFNMGATSIVNPLKVERKADDLFVGGRYQDAIEIYKKLSIMRKHNYQPQIEKCLNIALLKIKADDCFSKMQYEDAKQLLLKMKEINPKDIHINLQIENCNKNITINDAFLLFKAEKYKEALEMYKTLNPIYKNEPAVKSNIECCTMVVEALDFMSMEEYDKAIQLFYALERKLPNSGFIQEMIDLCEKKIREGHTNPPINHFLINENNKKNPTISPIWKYAGIGGATFLALFVLYFYLFTVKEGKETYQNGDWYEGEFLLGKRNGEGVYHYNDGSEYRGKWEDNQKNGEGYLIDAKGDTVLGGTWEANELKDTMSIYRKRNHSN
jgi:serine/threonine-protein kinase